LGVLNELIDAWKVERLTIFTITRSTWTITASDGEYTVGSGGDVNIARPSLPNGIRVGYIDTSADPDLETILPLLSDDEYQSLPMKAQTSELPTAVYYNPTFSSTGRGTLSFFPVPTSTTLSGVIYAPTPLDELSTIATTFYAPPGYRRFYITNLAKECAASFNAPVTDALHMAAEESKANIKRANIRLTELSLAGHNFGKANSGGYDILSDSYR
jgi:hypothetical protein